MRLQAAFYLSTAVYATAKPTPHKPHNSTAFNWNTTHSLIAFGDSYTFVQGTYGHANYSYITDNFNISFTPTQLLSDRIVQNLTGTAEGGPNWVEFLTKCGVERGLTNPLSCERRLWDFAYAGANTVSDVELTPPHWNHTVSFERQVEQFQKYGNPALETRAGLKGKGKEGALVAVWIGINDINDLVKIRGKNASFAPLYETLQSKVQENVEKIYDLGYRHFLFLNLPPLDRGPGTPSVNASLVETFNSIHAAHATAFGEEHKDATVLQFNVNSVLNRVLDNYEEYGYKNVTGFCAAYNQPDIETNPGEYGCGPLQTYFWYNSGHLTSRTHEIFTKELEAFLVEESAR